jgi:hypothetical protein
MSDFKFNCPHCPQRLSADPRLVGVEVDCPSCSSRVVVPAPPSTESTAPPSPDGSPSKVCPYCLTEIVDGDSPRICSACRTPHHEDCWRENKGCTVFGCTMAPPDEEPISVTVSPQTTYPAGSPNLPNHAFPGQPRKHAPGAEESIWWGILGFFCFGIIFGVVAISKANGAKKLIREQPDLYNGDGLATAGLVIGIIDLFAWAAVLIL